MANELELDIAGTEHAFKREKDDNGDDVEFGVIMVNFISTLSLDQYKELIDKVSNEHRVKARLV